jgi:hypothetical protein
VIPVEIPQTPEEEQNAEKERKLSEIEKASTADKNLQEAKAETPLDAPKVE